MNSLFGFNDLLWMVPLMATLFAGFFLVYRLPRFAVYLAGPAMFVSAAGLFVADNEAFFLFHSEGSAAGLFLPVLMWTVLLAIVGVGIALIRGGLGRLDEIGRGEDADATELPPAKYLKATGIVITSVILAYLIPYSILAALNLATSSSEERQASLTAFKDNAAAIGKRLKSGVPTTAQPQAEKPPVDAGDPRWLERAEPVRDFRADFEKGKYCFKQIKGLENEYPGTAAVDHGLVAAHEACVIADAAVDEYQDLMGKAEYYAKTYNSLAVETLRSSSSARPGTEASLAASAPHR